MKKIIAFGNLILLTLTAFYAQADSLYAYEYSSNYPHELRHDDYDQDLYRSNKSRMPSYQQQYSQQPIIVYPNSGVLRSQQERYLRQRMENEHEEHEWREQDREEQYWRRRRWELEHQPHTRGIENQFYRDDTHW